MFRSSLLKLFILLIAVSLTSFNCSWYKNWRAKQKAKKKSPTVQILPEDDNILPLAGNIDPLGTDTSIPWEGQAGLENGGTLSATGLPAPVPLNEPLREQPEGLLIDLDIVYFEYDSFQLSDTMISLLDRHAEWLIQYPDIIIQIEGHCDERGTFEYNMNLGQQRADAVRNYLISMGVDSERLYTISYGEERPLEIGADNQSLKKNRRVQFLAYGE